MIRVNSIPAVPGIPPGCSSPNGHYAGLGAVQTALEFGMEDTMAAAAAETYDEHYADADWPHADHWHDMVDEAERWLNDRTEGGLWHWRDGDFRLDSTTECPKCGQQMWADPDQQDTECGEHLDTW